jgi:hypothetical protein
MLCCYTVPTAFTTIVVLLYNKCILALMLALLSVSSAKIGYGCHTPVLLIHLDIVVSFTTMHANMSRKAFVPKQNNNCDKGSWYSITT